MSCNPLKDRHWIHTLKMPQECNICGLQHQRLSQVSAIGLHDKLSMPV